MCPEMQEEVAEANEVPTNRNLYHCKSTQWVAIDFFVSRDI